MPVIVNVKNSLKQCNGSVIIPNVPVNSEVNLSMYRDDGRVTAETYVGWIEQKYENKKYIRWLNNCNFEEEIHSERTRSNSLDSVCKRLGASRKTTQSVNTHINKLVFARSIKDRVWMRMRVACRISGTVICRCFRTRQNICGVHFVSLGVPCDVKDSLKQCNGSVIIPNGAVNSEVNLSMYRDDGRVAAETCVGWIEHKYETKKLHSLVEKLKINVKTHGEHNVEYI
jgi:hypothetical protein